MPETPFDQTIRLCQLLETMSVTAIGLILVLLGTAHALPHRYRDVIKHGYGDEVSLIEPTSITATKGSDLTITQTVDHFDRFNKDTFQQSEHLHYAHIFDRHQGAHALAAPPTIPATDFPRPKQITACLTDVTVSQTVSI
jgi:hypothetical protein